MLLVWIAIVSVVLTALTVLPPRRFMVPAALAFFVTIPVAELAPLFALFDLLLAAFALPSALRTLPAWEVGVASFGVVTSAIVLVWFYWAPVDEAAPFEERWRHLWPIIHGGYGVKVERGVEFDATNGLAMSLYLPEDTAAPTPALIYLHGGGWVIGFGGYQGRPLMVRMAQRGVACFSPDYRLSPRATFPDHLVDCKRAIAWVREHAHEYNVDPDRVMVAGNSAGAHLASLCALTPNLPTLQPGFEQARTDVLACLCFYGVYDLADVLARWPHKGLELLWRLLVIKKTREEAPELWRLASPAAHVGGSAPPFWLVHGTHDTLVPIEEARAFAKRLEQVTRVELCEMQNAQHAFELVASPRARTAVLLAERFAMSVLDDYATVTATRTRSRA